jgi:hypothetical protein
MLDTQYVLRLSVRCSGRNVRGFPHSIRPDVGCCINDQMITRDVAT